MVLIQLVLKMENSYYLKVAFETQAENDIAQKVVILDKDEYKALVDNKADNQVDEEELEYLKACQYALESFYEVRGLCPKCKKSVIIDGWVCPCCRYDSSGEELYKYGD